MHLVPGLSFHLASPVKRISELIELAEQRSFESALLTDSQLIGRDLYVALALALKRTRRIRVGPGVTNPLTRDPSVTAGVAATLEELAPGRVMIGIGVGDSAVNTLHRRPASLAELKRAVRTIGSLVEGREVRANGAGIKIPWAKRHIPIYIASTGPKSLRLAGAVGDGVIVNVGADVGLINWALGHLEKGARGAGRSLADLDIWVRITCSVDDDVAKARASLRGGAAAKANGLARYAKDPSFRKHLSPALMKDIDNLAKHYDYYEHLQAEASHTRFVTDRIFETLVIAGPPSYCASRIREIIEQTGQGRLSCATYGFPDIPGFIERFSREVAQPLQRA